MTFGRDAAARTPHSVAAARRGSAHIILKCMRRAGRLCARDSSVVVRLWRRATALLSQAGYQRSRPQWPRQALEAQLELRSQSSTPREWAAESSRTGVPGWQPVLIFHFYHTSPSRHQGPCAKRWERSSSCALNHRSHSNERPRAHAQVSTPYNPCWFSTFITRLQSLQPGMRNTECGLRAA